MGLPRLFEAIDACYLRKAPADVGKLVEAWLKRNDFKDEAYRMLGCDRELVLPSS